MHLGGEKFGSFLVWCAAKCVKFRLFVKCLKSWPLNNFSEGRMSTCADPVNLHTRRLQMFGSCIFCSKFTLLVGVCGSVWEPLLLFCISCKFPLIPLSVGGKWRTKRALRGSNSLVRRFNDFQKTSVAESNTETVGLQMSAVAFEWACQFCYRKHFSALLATPFSANSTWGTCLIYFCSDLRVEGVPFERTPFSLKVEWDFYSDPL